MTMAIALCLIAVILLVRSPDIKKEIAILIISAIIIICLVFLALIFVLAVAYPVWVLPIITLLVIGFFSGLREARKQ